MRANYARYLEILLLSLAILPSFLNADLGVAEGKNAGALGHVCVSIGEEGNEYHYSLVGAFPSSAILSNETLSLQKRMEIYLRSAPSNSTVLGSVLLEFNSEYFADLVYRMAAEDPALARMFFLVAGMQPLSNITAHRSGTEVTFRASGAIASKVGNATTQVVKITADSKLFHVNITRRGPVYRENASDSMPFNLILNLGNEIYNITRAFYKEIDLSVSLPNRYKIVEISPSPDKRFSKGKYTVVYWGSCPHILNIKYEPIAHGAVESLLPLLLMILVVVLILILVLRRSRAGGEVSGEEGGEEGEEKEWGMDGILWI